MRLAEAGLNQDTGDAASIERGRLLFARECRFLAASATPGALPPPGPPEVAFAGRSNVGKSSLINALVGHRALARTSQTPGRTQSLNFFEIEGLLRLVDLPGYGFARAPKTKAYDWNRLVRDYLRGRATLRRLVLLIDARRGLTANDRSMIDFLAEQAVVFQVVLTKIDRLSRPDAEAVLHAVSTEISRVAAAFPHVFATSAQDGTGIEELRASLAALAASG